MPSSRLPPRVSRYIVLLVLAGIAAARFSPSATRLVRGLRQRETDRWWHEQIPPALSGRAMIEYAPGTFDAVWTIWIDTATVITMASGLAVLAVLFFRWTAGRRRPQERGDMFMNEYRWFPLAVRLTGVVFVGLGIPHVTETFREISSELDGWGVGGTQPVEPWRVVVGILLLLGSCAQFIFGLYLVFGARWFIRRCLMSVSRAAQCLACGYDLQGSRGAVCPECGVTSDGSGPMASPTGGESGGQ